MKSIGQWLAEHHIEEIEAIVPDMTGVPRGKILPAQRYVEAEGMRLPEGIFLQTVTGEYPRDQSAINPADADIVLRPDASTLRRVPNMVSARRNRVTQKRKKGHRLTRFSAARAAATSSAS